jgi:Flp pilus assembly protein TadG
MPFRPARRFRKTPFRRGLLRATDGSAAVEFGMLAFPFLLMIFAILELCLVFVLDSVLDNATARTGRLVRTGQASAASMTPEQFKASLCSRMSIFSADCADRVTIDVREIEQFAIVPPDPMVAGTFDSGVLTYTNGDPGDLILVRVWYRHPLITTFLAQGLSRLNDGTVRLTATTAFRNEPA